MPTTSINDNNISPISVDLTNEVPNLNIIRGLVEMKRVDQPIPSGISLVMGEWGVLGADGNLSRPTATPAAASFLCFAGTDRYDARATGQCTMIMNSAIMMQTTYYDDTQQMAPLDNLTAALLTGGANAGKAGLRLAQTGEPVHAHVYGVSGGVLTASVLPL